MKTLLQRIGGRVQRAVKIYLLNDPFEKAIQRWVADRGDATLRLDYALGPDSVVFDCGGYQGDWAAQIDERYHSRLFVFEPVASFARQIEERFEGRSNIRVFTFGLHKETTTAKIRLDENATSTFRGTGAELEIALVDVADFVRENKVERIDLIKINIEGGEFDLLDRLIETGIITQCVNIQVQFHQFVEGSAERRAKLQRALATTHHQTYNYDFVWENWTRNDNRSATTAEA